MARASTQALSDEIDAAVGKYCGRISYAEVVGVLILRAVGIAMQMHARDEDDEGEDEKPE